MASMETKNLLQTLAKAFKRNHMANEDEHERLHEAQGLYDVAKGALNCEETSPGRCDFILETDLVQTLVSIALDKHLCGYLQDELSSWLEGVHMRRWVCILLSDSMF